MTHAERNAKYRAKQKALGKKDDSCERVRKKRQKEKALTIERIGTWDCETDPFDPENMTPVYPFLICMDLGYEKWHIWKQPGEELDDFLQKFIDKVKSIPDKFILYAHNGGRFDMRYFLKWFRGQVNFKNASTIMSVTVGNCELRDSLHIIPTKLASFKKDEINYRDMAADRREQHKQGIIDYCYNDCTYARQMIKEFWQRYGNMISIGQAAFGVLKKSVGKGEIDYLSEHRDGEIRGICTSYYDKENYGKQVNEGFFKGGRTECINGMGSFYGDYKLYDVNSMYPYVMVHYRHPVGSNFTHHSDKPNANTAFVHVCCRSQGAFLKYDNDKLSGEHSHAEFRVTIHEYNIALELGLISDIEIIECIDCDKFMSFGEFVQPIYDKRQEVKTAIEDWKKSGREQAGTEWDRLTLDDLFLKLLLNNAYGKFAQNPRKFRDIRFLDINEQPDFEWEHYSTIGEDSDRAFKIYTVQQNGIWDDDKGCYNLRKDEHRLRFYNVATGASITGAARSYLLFALFHSVDPIYCDTDSIICRSMGDKVNIHQTELGGWKIDKELEYVVIVGKKMYGYRTKKGKESTKSKGVQDVDIREMERLLKGAKIKKTNKGVTINDDGTQEYITRALRPTATIGPGLFRRHHNERTLPVRKLYAA